jgi:hypothetical protein
MKEFFVKVFLEPFAAILFCLAFGVPFVYFGFQTVHVEGQKDHRGSVTIEFTRKHYWGLWQVNECLEEVQNATRKTSITHRSGPRRIRLTSGVFIETETGAVRLLAGSSTVDDKLKLETVNSINDFINDPTQTDFEKKIRVSNVFGWVGLPFLVLGVLGLIGWPGSIIRHLKER